MDAERLLLVASDRVSAFDVVMREPVPHKGAVLTQISAFWFARSSPRSCRTTASPPTPTRSCGGARARAAPRPARGPRDAGAAAPSPCRSSAWCAATSPARRGRSTSDAGTLAGEPLPAGLVESDRLEPPIFTPATKAEIGHDENMTVRRDGAPRSATRRAAELGTAQLRGLRGRRAIRGGARHHHRRHQVRVRRPRRRHAPADRRGAHARLLALLARRRLPPGRRQPSFDKQPLRDYLARAAERRDAGTARRPPPPLPAEVVARDQRRYLDAFRRLTGQPLPGGRLMRIAPEGWPFIAGRAAVDRGAGLARLRARGRAGRWLAAGCPIALWVVAFFRDPERTGPRGDRLVIAPADGKRRAASPRSTSRCSSCGTRHADLDLHERLQRAREPVSGRAERCVPALQPGQVPATPPTRRRASKRAASVGLGRRAGRCWCARSPG